MTLNPVAFAGYRNVLLIESYLLWSGWVIWLVRPPNGYTDALLYAIGYLLVLVGGVVVAGMTARAANKMADKWEPGAFRPKSAVETPSTTHKYSTTEESSVTKP